MPPTWARNALFCVIAASVAHAHADWHSDVRDNQQQSRADAETDVADGPQAEPVVPDWTGLAVAFHLGIATPYGLTGIALDGRPLDWLAVEAGIGLSPQNGAQAGVMPRLRLPLRDTALTAGSGFSVGRFEPPDLGLDFSALCHSESCESVGTSHWQRAYWSNVELGAEGGSNAMLFRAYAGYGQTLNDYDRCIGGECSNRRAWLLYFGVSLSFYLLH